MPEVALTNKWYKFDFHTHTPASRDYREVIEPSAHQWLHSAMDAKLDCVAITDHNSGGWVDLLRSAYEDIQEEEWFRPLCIFPGCELTLSLGAFRIHLLAIFDPSYSTESITRFLGSCELQGTIGDPEECFTTLSIETVVRKIIDANGIAIPAHIDTVKGLLHNVKNTNPDIKKHLSLFESAQFVDLEHVNAESLHIDLKKDMAHLAIVRGSDAHTLAAIGASSSWVKMGNPTIEGLKFALKDHNFCLLNQDDNPNSTPRSYIKSLTIKGMRHCGMNPQNIPTFQLHPLFNSIIGGRGTGKSTFIESLRLSLGRSQDTEDLVNVHQDINNFVDGVTTEHSKIEILLKKNTSEYKVNWKKNTPLNFERNSESGWIEDAGNIKERFPVNIYSQKQINALASNPNSLLEIIDRSSLVNISVWAEAFEEKKRTYLQLCSDETGLKHSIAQEGAKLSRLEEVSTDITNFESGGHRQVLSRNQLMSNVKRSVEKAGDIKEISRMLDELCMESKPTLDLSAYDSLPNVLKLDLESTQAIFERELSDIFIGIEQLKLRLDKAKSNRESTILNSNWVVAKEQSEQRYKEVVANYQRRGVTFNSDEYEEWLDERNQIEQQLLTIEAEKARRIKILESQENILTELIEMRKELQVKRQQFINDVLLNNEYVQMTVQPFSDVSKIERSFRDLIGNERFASSIYEKDSETSLLHALIHSDKSFAQKIIEQKKIIKALELLVQGGDPDGYRIDRRFGEFLKGKYDTQPEFLARLKCWMPDDYLDVRYSQPGTSKQFTSINKGSAGQKAAAILAFLLSHGDEPIIVDQPEDDLDNALVYSLIVNQIQTNKKRRQIIIVTHNPNIVVNGDAELVNVMEFRGGQVQIKTSGSLIEKNIRDEVCEIMEGGREAFNKRFQRISSL